MKILIIERSAKVRHELQQIIESKSLGDVEGMFELWEDAFLRMSRDGAEVVVAGLSAHQDDDLAFIERSKKKFPEISFVVLIQGYDRELVRKAYEFGAEFVLHKPVCEVELDHILRNVDMARAMRWLLRRAGTEFCGCSQGLAVHPQSQGDQLCNLYIRRLKGILRDIGILNEAGSKDIICIALYLSENNLNFQEITMKELCSMLNQNTKSVEQRIRRAALTGLSNLANRGLEDYADPAFNEYAGKFYQMDQVKREMNYIMGKSEKHGCVRIRKFLLGLFEYC